MSDNNKVPLNEKKESSLIKSSVPSLIPSVIPAIPLIELSVDLSVISTVDGVFLKVSPSSEDILGYKPEEMVGKSYKEFVLNETDIASTDHVLGNQRIYRFVNRYKKKNGGFVLFSWNASLYDNYYYAIARDVTLERGKFDVRQFYHLALDIFAIFDLNGVFLKASPSCKKIIGYTPAELEGKAYSEFIHTSDLPDASTYEGSGKAITDYQNRYYHKNGDIVWLSWTTCINDGMIYAIARDITKDKLIEEKNMMELMSKRAMNEIIKAFITSKNKTLYDLLQFISVQILNTTKTKYMYINHFIEGVTKDEDKLALTMLTPSVEKDSSDEVKRDYWKAFSKERISDLAFVRKDNPTAPWWKAYNEKRPVFVNYDEKECKCPFKPRGEPMYNFVAIPLIFSERVIGEVGLANRENGFSQDMIELVQPLLTALTSVIISKENEDKLGQLHSKHIVAEAKAKERSNFINIMSHEIRTPLNGIVSTASFLDETSLDAQQSEYLKDIQVSCEHLVHVINDVLDIAKFEEGKVDLVEKVFNLYRCIDNSITLAFNKSCNYKIRIHRDFHTLPLYVIGDVYRISQIFINLIGNAVKYMGKDGWITLGGTVIKELTDKLLIEFYVKDDGIGIPKSRQSGLFQAFYRVRETSESVNGTGLGLMITKNLVELMGGSIRLESDRDEGCNFIFTLMLRKHRKYGTLTKPLADLETDQPLPPTPNKERMSPRIQTDKTVFILDKEEEPIYKSISPFLQKYSLPAKEVVDSKVDEKDVLASDILVTHHDNHDRFLPKYNKPMIVSCPANTSTPELRLRRIDRKLREPISFSRVKDIIEEIINMEKGVTAPKTVSRNINMEKDYPARILLVEDNKINMKVIVRILKKLGYKPDKAYDGLEAVEKATLNDYDIILMDMRMPGMNGPDATATILKRLSEENREFPVIVALTANVYPAAKEQCRRVGMRDFLSKPIQIPELKEILRKHARVNS